MMLNDNISVNMVYCICCHRNWRVSYTTLHMAQDLVASAYHLRLSSYISLTTLL